MTHRRPKYPPAEPPAPARTPPYSEGEQAPRPLQGGLRMTAPISLAPIRQPLSTDGKNSARKAETPPHGGSLRLRRAKQPLHGLKYAIPHAK